MAKQKSILLAEDDDNLGQLLQTFLKAKGYQVELARNGKHAYEKYTDGHFDFCIFDVMMPEMDPLPDSKSNEGRQTRGI